jgi:hypothetical protein
VGSSLPLHEVREDEPDLLGVFLIGAHQEIFGDMHNLFGDTDAVNVELTAEGGYPCSMESRHGDTVEELLRHVEFEPAQLLGRYRDKIATAGLRGPRSRPSTCGSSQAGSRATPTSRSRRRENRPHRPWRHGYGHGAEPPPSGSESVPSRPEVTITHSPEAECKYVDITLCPSESLLSNQGEFL